MSPASSRPALRYYGGAWRKAPWVVSYMPPHKNYVEPCMGACSILLHKPRAYRETVNDINGRVTNFFRVLREPQLRAQLVESLHWTPWHEAELEAAWDRSDDAVEDARRFYVLSWMGFGGAPGDAWAGRRALRVRLGIGSGGDVTNSLTNLTPLIAAGERLRGVQIYERDALEVMERFLDDEQALIVFDPPFLVDVRSRQHQHAYGNEMRENEHRTAADLLDRHRGTAIVLGRPTDLYAEIYEARGWERVDRPFRENGGGRAVESIWLSPSLIQRGAINFGLFADQIENGAVTGEVKTA